MMRPTDWVTPPLPKHFAGDVCNVPIVASGVRRREPAGAMRTPVREVILRFAGVILVPEFGVVAKSISHFLLLVAAVYRSAIAMG